MPISQMLRVAYYVWGQDIKKLPREDVVASHTEQQPGSAHLPSQTGSHGGEDQYNPQCLEEQRSTHAMCHIHESRFNIWKRTVGWPDPLAEVNFKPAYNSSKEANQNGG